jgi:hypothetical protein
VRTAQTTLGDIKVPVRAERQPARIVQASREDRDNRGVMPLLLVAGGCLGASRETDPGERDRKQHGQQPSHLVPLPEQIK